ncbi:universal stress protein [Dyella flava]|uniref:Universal stress protein n=1 Tax=Dyella flava TaxID=1920170 RepID=A0ABS2JZU6_9GAMM|nr:universal stress protein [Dyella flava]MBM7124518.1 universal stress protein [Dyella flava]GLQ51814.1 hypothetical protein GCM10010872_32630 [Dyella flava]
MIKHILVAVGHDANCQALQSAIKLARENNAHISVVHVVDWMPRFILAESQDFGALINCLEEQGREVVAEVTQKLNESGCRGEAHMITLSVQEFTVGKAIASFARKVDADLIVLGQTRSSFWRWFQEDVSSEVRQHAVTPLHVTGSNAKRAVRSIWRPFARLAVSQ